MKIGIAGHPEGSPDISDSDLEKAKIGRAHVRTPVTA